MERNPRHEFLKFTSKKLIASSSLKNKMSIARYFGLWIGDERIVKMPVVLESILSYKIYVEEILEMWKNPWADMGKSPTQAVCDDPKKFRRFMELKSQENDTKRNTNNKDGAKGISLFEYHDKLTKKNK